MLVLSRKVGERILIGGNVVVEVLEARGRQVRLGITAPAEISIRREELPLPAPGPRACLATRSEAACGA